MAGSPSSCGISESEQKWAWLVPEAPPVLTHTFCPLSTQLRRLWRKTSGSLPNFCFPWRGSTTRSRRWSDPTRRPRWPGGRACWTAWRKRSFCWGRSTPTWRSSRTLTTTSTSSRLQTTSLTVERYRCVSSLTSSTLWSSTRAGSLCPVHQDTKTSTKSAWLHITLLMPPSEPSHLWKCKWKKPARWKWAKSQEQVSKCTFVCV